MPVGQSRAQPLQDRHRSSDSATAGSSKPELPGDDVLEHVGAAAGGVLLVAGRQVRRAHHATGSSVVRQALADAGAPVHGLRQRPGVVGESQRRPGAPLRQRQAQVGVERCGIDQDSRVEQVVGVEHPLGLLHQGDRLRGVHPRQQLRARPPVAVLPRHRAAVRRDEVCCLLDEAAVPATPRPVVELEVDPHVHAAVAEVAVGNPVETALREQRVEVAQVVAQPLRGDGGVLPPGLRLAGQGAGGEAGAVLADPPQRELLGHVGHHPVPDACRGGDGAGPGLRLRLRCRR